jgi:hypothetical protein
MPMNLSGSRFWGIHCCGGTEDKQEEVLIGSDRKSYTTK